MGTCLIGYEKPNPTPTPVGKEGLLFAAEPLGTQRLWPWNRQPRRQSIGPGSARAHPTAGWEGEGPCLRRLENMETANYPRIGQLSPHCPGEACRAGGVHPQGMGSPATSTAHTPKGPLLPKMSRQWGSQTGRKTVTCKAGPRQIDNRTRRGEAGGRAEGDSAVLDRRTDTPSRCQTAMGTEGRAWEGGARLSIWR